MWTLLFINRQTRSEHLHAPGRGFCVLSVSCFTERLLCLWMAEGMRPKPNSLAGRSFREHYEVRCVLCCSVSPIPQPITFLRLSKRKAWGVTGVSPISQIHFIISPNAQWPILYVYCMILKCRTSTKCKRLHSLVYFISPTSAMKVAQCLWSSMCLAVIQ